MLWEYWEDEENEEYYIVGVGVFEKEGVVAWLGGAWEGYADWHIDS